MRFVRCHSVISLLFGFPGARFDYILTSDTTYSPELSPVLIDFIAALLRPNTDKAVSEL